MQPQKSKRIWLRTIIVVLLLVVAPMVAFYTMENHRGAKAWADFEASMTELGYSLNIEEIWPPQLPDEENFWKQPEMLAWQNSASPPSLYKTPGIESPKSRYQSGPRFGAPQDFRNILTKSPKDNEACAADFLRLIQHWESDMTRCEDLARQFKGWKPLQRFGEIPEYDESLSIKRDLSKLFTERAKARSQLGDGVGSFEDCETVFRLSRVDPPTSILEAMLRGAFESYALGAIWEGLHSRCWSDHQLQKLDSLCAETQLLKVIETATQFEAALIADYRQTWRQDRSQFATHLATCWPQTDHWLNIGNRHCLQFAPIGWADVIAARGAETYRDFGLRGPDGWSRYHPKRLRALDAELMLQIEAKPVDHCICFPGLRESFGESFMRSGVMLTQARIAIALERYRLANGEFPTKLSQLSPLTFEPIDFFAQDEMRYELNESGFKLWSIGDDLVDDGGHFEDKAKDYVWQHRWE